MTLTSRQKVISLRPIYFTLLLYIFPIFFKNPSLFFLATGLDSNHSFATTKLKLFNLTSPLKTWIILAFFFYIILMPFYFLSFSI